MATFVGDRATNSPRPEWGRRPVPRRSAAKTQFRIVAKRFFRHKAARAGLIVLALIILLAFSSIGFGPIPGWWKYDYTEFEPTLTDGGAPTLSIFPPAWGDHPFGQGNDGRDYFALTMRGLQQSLIIAFIVGIVATIVGTVIGAVSGYYRGRIESVLMRFTDVMITIPLLAIAAVIAGKIGGSGIVGLGGAARPGHLDRAGPASSVVSSSRCGRRSSSTPRVRSAPPAGGSSSGTSCRTPSGVITVSATLAISGAILLETALSFLNFGVKSSGHLTRAVAPAVPPGDGRAAVAVLVARCVHRAHLAVGELHRRRPA